MKKWIAAIAAIVTIFTANVLSAQSKGSLTVYGYAEKAVEPDEIYLSLTLSENADQAAREPISKMEQKLLGVLKEAGIPNSQVFVEGINGYANYQFETQEFLLSKVYSIKLNNLKQADQLSAKLAGVGAASSNFMNFGHSKSKDLIKELKPKAMQAARTEAENLAGIAGKKLGGIVSIEEVQDPFNPSYNIDPYAVQPAAGAVGGSTPSVKQLTVRYSVKVVFELQ